MSEEKLKSSDEMFCSSCGAVIKKEAEICPKCGVRQKDYEEEASPKSRMVAFLLCIFFGLFGAHHFYAGKIMLGIVQILLGWATLFIWNIVDLIMILSGTFRDKNGRVIRNW